MRTAAEQKLFILWPITNLARCFSLLENQMNQVCGRCRCVVLTLCHNFVENLFYFFFLNFYFFKEIDKYFPYTNERHLAHLMQKPIKQVF